MTDDTQTEALLPSRETLMAQAQVFASAWSIASGDGMEMAEQEKAILADMTRLLYARIAELESELEAIGAGGVSGPLVGRAAPPTAQAEGWTKLPGQLQISRGHAIEMMREALEAAPQRRRRWLSEQIDQLERKLAIIGVVGVIDGHDVVRRESVLEIARRAAIAAQGGKT